MFRTAKNFVIKHGTKISILILGAAVIKIADTQRIQNKVIGNLLDLHVINSDRIENLSQTDK